MQNGLKAWLPLLICLASTVSCDFTEKIVSGKSGLAITDDVVVDVPDQGGGDQGLIDQIGELTVLSHISGQRVSTQQITLAGDCDSTLGDVTVSGDVIGSPVQISCNNQVYSSSVILLNFNQANNFTVIQSGAVENLIDFTLTLFVRAPFCGDEIVNQSFESCDGESFCDEFCQNGSNLHPDLVLARVNINSTETVGQGKSKNDVFLGSATQSIPAGVWFPIFLNGSFFVDPPTPSFETAPGLLVRRLTTGIKIALSTRLSLSDFEHIDGSLEFHNAVAVGVTGGIAAESLELGFDGFAELDPDQDEVFIESGASLFWMSESTGEDAYFTQWN